MTSPRRRDTFEPRPKTSSSTVSIKILIPSFTVGAVIGKGGEVIKSMKKESGAHIRVSQNGKYYPTTNERIAFISGSNEQVHQVICMINEKIRTDKPPENKRVGNDLSERKTQMKLIIPSSSAGKIIGKGGCNIKEMKEKLEVSVRIQNHEESIEGLDERIVTVTGSPESIEASASTILTHVEEDNFGRIDNNLDYDMFCYSNYWGGYHGYYDHYDNGYGHGGRGGYGYNGPPQRYNRGEGGERGGYGGYDGYRGGYSNGGRGGGGGGGYNGGYGAPPRYVEYNNRQSRARGRS